MLMQASLSENESDPCGIVRAMNDVAGRVRSLRIHFGLTQTEFAERLSGVTRGAVGNWELGKGVKRENLEQIAKVFGASYEWLSMGRGEMLYSAGTHVVPAGEEFDPDPVFDPDGTQAVAYQEPFRGSLPGGSPEIDARAGAGQGQIGLERMVTLDSGGVVTGHRVVGEWILPPDMVRHEMQANPSRTWVVAVVGDSMSPTLKTGDRVFVDTMHTRLSPDGLYVIDEGDGPMVKRLHRIRDSNPPAAEIISDNEHHPRFARTLDRFRIIGRVCGRFEVM